jgi:hypothetical protein
MDYIVTNKRHIKLVRLTTNRHVKLVHHSGSFPSLPLASERASEPARTKPHDEMMLRLVHLAKSHDKASHSLHPLVTSYNVGPGDSIELKF